MIVPAEVRVGVVRRCEAEVSERGLCHAGSQDRGAVFLFCNVLPVGYDRFSRSPPKQAS